MSWPDEFTVLRALLVKTTIGPRANRHTSPSPGDDPGDHKNNIRMTRGRTARLSGLPLCLLSGHHTSVTQTAYFGPKAATHHARDTRAKVKTRLGHRLLYVKRWLAAPLQHSDGALIERTRGTPQGSAVSPVLANLFMHYAFDAWMARNYPGCPFERYADDAIVHCTTRSQAEYVLGQIAARMAEVGLRLHPDKTRIVYCKDSNRRGKHEHTSFTFLGFAFRQRQAINRETGEKFSSFSPAISPKALKAKGDRLRELRIHRRTDLTLNDLAAWLNPIVAGWMRYYGRFYRSALDPLLRRVSFYLKRWAGKKYKRLRTHKRFQRWWTGLQRREPSLFAHWAWSARTDGR